MLHVENDYSPDLTRMNGISQAPSADVDLVVFVALHTAHSLGLSLPHHVLTNKSANSLGSPVPWVGIAAVKGCRASTARNGQLCKETFAEGIKLSTACSSTVFEV